MTKREQTTTSASPDAGRPPAEQALLKALAEQPDATVAELAAATGVGRSTASKLLARLESAGAARRKPGGRDGRRRLPDRWAPATIPKPSSSGRGAKASASEKTQRADGPSAIDRLRPGQLDGLVLAYLKKNAKSTPHGPGAIAKALGRSSGAVGNCLVRLTRDKQVREVSEKPRRYTLPT
jgi:DNA-binding transcriptional ArsR family regulator